MGNRYPAGFRHYFLHLALLAGATATCCGGCEAPTEEERQARLRAWLDSTPEALIVIDRPGMLVFKAELKRWRKQGRDIAGAESGLLSMLDHETDPRRHLCIVVGLGVVGGDQSASVLLGMISDSEEAPEVKILACRALGEIGGPRVLRGLRKLLETGDEASRSDACVALGYVGGPEAREYLVQALRDESEDVRYYARIGLKMALKPGR